MTERLNIYKSTGGFYRCEWSPCTALILIFPVKKLTKSCGVVGPHDVSEGELDPELEWWDPALPRGHLPPQLIPPGPRRGDRGAVQVGEPGQGVERVLVEAAIPWDEIFLVFSLSIPSPNLTSCH